MGDVGYLAIMVISGIIESSISTVMLYSKSVSQEVYR